MDDIEKSRKFAKHVRKGRDGLWYATVMIEFGPTGADNHIRYGYRTRAEARKGKESDTPVTWNNRDE